MKLKIDAVKPIRRVVTGVDEQGRSKVVWDGPAPNVAPATEPGISHVTNFWIWNNTPPLLSGINDDGNLPYEFPAPIGGGHLRTIQAPGKPADYDAAQDPRLLAGHAPKVRPSGRVWDRAARNIYSSDMHKTKTIDYAILLEGERPMVLDDAEVHWQPGDVIIQVGAYHKWTSPRQGGIVAFDMFDADFPDGPSGLAQGNDKVLIADPNRKMPDGIKPSRRIVTIDKEPGRSTLVTDGPSPDIRLDPARPGYAAARMWVTDSMPAKIVFETLHLPHTIEPPPNGSVLRVLTIPPDDAWKGKVGSAEVKAYFQAMGSPNASAYSSKAPHPYMQKTRTLDFGFVLQGEIVLVLDTQEVRLKAGDIIIQRGTSHAWSNRSGKPAVVAIASHDAR